MGIALGSQANRARLTGRHRDGSPNSYTYPVQTESELDGVFDTRLGNHIGLVCQDLTQLC